MVISYKLSLNEKVVKTSSVEKIHKIISKDLEFNDYSFQKEYMIKYKGKYLAEYLELMLFICPSCKSLCTLKSEGDFFFCSNCYLKTRYTEEGYLKFISMHSNLNIKKFENPQNWNKWQLRYLKNYYKNLIKNKNRYKILLMDKNVIMFTGIKEKPIEKFNIGRLILNSEGIVFNTIANKNFHFTLERIYGENIQRSNKFEFYYNNKLHRFHFINKRIKKN